MTGLHAFWYLSTSLILFGLFKYISQRWNAKNAKIKRLLSIFQEMKDSITSDPEERETIQFFLIKLRERLLEYAFDPKTHYRGYPEALFVDNEGLENCICSICYDVFNSPKAFYCGHTFCKDCLAEFSKSTSSCKTCPECRSFVTTDNTNKVIALEKLIQNRLVRCPSALYDPSTPCKYVGKLSDCSSHVQKCNHCRVKCLCGKLIRKIDYANPSFKCDCKIEYCRFCAVKMTARLMPVTSFF